MFSDFAQEWGNIASVARLFLSLMGFGWTIWLAWQAKSAAQEAEKAANEARQAISRSQIIADIAEALTIMDEIKRLHRAAAWPILLERYSTLRRMLVSVRSAHPELSDEHKSAIQNAIQIIADLEKIVDTPPSSEKDRLNLAEFNSLVSVQMDILTDLLVKVKQERRK